MQVDLGALEEIVPRICNLRADLSAHPEVGPEVSRTAGKVVEVLGQTSLRVRERAGFPEQSAMGVIADLRGIDATETVALVADMSAQNVRRPDLTGASARCSHVAGNDAHTAMLLGAALLLHRADVKRNVRFIWQSGGEMLSDGSQAMIRDGALDGVDEVFAVHLWPGLSIGSVGVVAGPVMASLDRFVVRVHGSGAMRPWHHRRIDGIRIGSSFVEALDRMNGERERKEGAHCVVTHFLAGQNRESLSPDEVRLEGEIRAFSEADRQAAGARLEQVAAEQAAGHGGTAQLRIRSRGNVTVNSAQSAAHARERLVQVPGAGTLESLRPSAFSTGLGGYLDKVPGAVLALGCGGDTPEPANLLLSPGFDFDDTCLEIGVRVLAALAVG